MLVKDEMLIRKIKFTMNSLLNKEYFSSIHLNANLYALRLFKKIPYVFL